MDRISKFLIAASIVCYIISLPLPAFYTSVADGEWIGLVALISGFFGLLAGYLCWAANPLLLLLWILAVVNRFRVLRICIALIVLMLMCEFLRHDWVYANEAGTKASITGLGLGYGFWILSSVLMIIQSIRPVSKLSGPS